MLTIYYSIFDNKILMPLISYLLLQKSDICWLTYYGVTYLCPPTKNISFNEFYEILENKKLLLLSISVLLNEDGDYDHSIDCYNVKYDEKYDTYHQQLIPNENIYFEYDINSSKIILYNKDSNQFISKDRKKIFLMNQNNVNFKQCIELEKIYFCKIKPSLRFERSTICNTKIDNSTVDTDTLQIILPYSIVVDVIDDFAQIVN